MITFVVIANRQGKTRFSAHYHNESTEDRKKLEKDIVQLCLMQCSRKGNSTAFVNHHQLKVVYRCYGNLVVIVATKGDDNELAVYEFINLFVQTLNLHFDTLSEANVSFRGLVTNELAACCKHHRDIHLTNTPQIIFDIEKIHLILQEMVINGEVFATSIKRTLASIQALNQLELEHS